MCRPAASPPLHPTPPCPSPTLPLVQSPHAKAGGARHTPEDLRLCATTMPTLPPAWAHAPAPQCSPPSTLSGEALALWHHVCRTHVLRVAPCCALAPPAALFSTTSAANPSS